MTMMSPAAVIKSAAIWACDAVAMFVLPIAAAFASCRTKPIEIGFGPWPTIASIHQKASMIEAGYLAETFVFSGEKSVSEFDFIGERHVIWPFGLLLPYYMFVRAIFRYRVIYLYFNGGPLGQQPFCKYIEPLLFCIAATKIVVMPYGSDVQEMSRSPNLLFKHFMGQHDPNGRGRRKEIERRIDRWTKWADHVISGVEWVDYMYHWDTLTLTHFGIDLDQWPQVLETPWSRGERDEFVILHAPNHPLLKGTQYFEQAVTELRAEGLPVALRVIQNRTNNEIRSEIARADAVADQLVIGWYAMFAMEGMAVGRPVFCFLRPDLVELYVNSGVLNEADLPIINCGPHSVKAAIRVLVNDRTRWREIANRSRAFVEKYHSSKAMAPKFADINVRIGLAPRPAKS